MSFFPLLARNRFSPHTQGMDRRVTAQELGDFLRTRREKIRPPSDAISTVRTRRTAGMRREEIADIAGVSSDYYTRLEQGRALNPSLVILDALADALQLDADERLHLHDISLRLTAAHRESRHTPPVRLDDAARRALNAVSGAPAMVLDHRLDILAWNNLAALLLMDFSVLPADERNTTRLLFTNVAFADKYTDWEAVARQNVAFLRASSGRHPHDTRIRDLVDDLSTTDTPFKQWWESHDVEEKSSGTKVIRHEIVGELTLSYDALQLPGRQDTYLVIYSAPSDSATAAGLALLQILDASNASRNEQNGQI